MSIFRNIALDPNTISFTADGSSKNSELRTLGDYKLLNEDRPLFFDGQGTGTGSYASNKFDMSVTSGQYYIRQTRRYHPYFSGNPQVIEITFDNFNLEANVTKRVGYFSSNAVAPYASSFDGFWLENTGTTYILKCARNGTETISVDWTLWDNYSQVSSYNFDNFTVLFFDFLWLGGAVLRIWLKTNKGFILCHTVNYSGTSQDVMMLSPNQPIRYEIRSTTGSGNFRYICAKCGSYGDPSEPSIQGSFSSAYTGVTLANIGTVYVLLAMRKKTTHRDLTIKPVGLDCYVTSNADQLLITLLKNPTIAGGSLSYSSITNAPGLEVAIGNGTLTASGGFNLAERAAYQNQNIVNPPLLNNYLAELTCSLANTQDEIVLVGTPMTTTIVALPTIDYSIY